MENNRFLTISNEDYHKDTLRISKSGLDEIDKSPAHYYYKYFDPERVPEKQSPALLLGSMVHCAVFEPEEFDKRYIIMPSFDMRTTKGKEGAMAFIEQNQGKDYINSKDYDICKRMFEACHKHPAAKMLLNKGGLTEQTFYFNEIYFDIPCKFRTDFIPEGTNFIVDLKTTADASPEGFGRSAFNYRYDVQSAFYTDGWYGCDMPYLDFFIFIAVEKEPPYNVGVYYASAETLNCGRNRYLGNIETLSKCRESGIWPGYSDKIEALNMPYYANKQVYKQF